MSEFPTTLLLVAAAINPPAVIATVQAAGRDPLAPRVVITAFLAAAVLLVAAALAADAFLDAIRLEPETFRIPAAIVMVATGVAVILFGPFSYSVERSWKGALFPLAFPLLAGPAALAAALTRAADAGAAGTELASLLVLAVVSVALWRLPATSSAISGALARLVGAVLIFFAAGVLIDGIQSV